MASEVDISNLALSRLGDAATVASIDPPEGSPQAGHCARWYPICRDLLLEQHAWSFASKRVALALVGSAWPEWQFAYELPADCIKPWAVLPPDALNDYSVGMPQAYGNFTGAPADRVIDIGAAYVPQDFSVETDNTDSRLVYSNQQNAVLRYTARVNDPTRFTPLFVDAFAWLMASYLAGPIIKGDAGAAAGQTCYRAYLGALAKATASDGNARQVNVKQVVPWMARR
ncbi:conserved hypothetical protein [Cupriavidus taiwanensis]|uniref:hypothetical protein n=1 Tax=Cupriavidus taiwanensis TaxID=164546 RepID=UPI000E1591CA|nr:hypothetical protein [Cupriavidus taiwanensis]SPA25876.1 conserved hypothetical protein [Cupriavidus taiwanensis]